MSEQEEFEIPAPKPFWVRIFCRHRWVHTTTYTTNNFLTGPFLFGTDDYRREIVYEHSCARCGATKETSV